MRDIQTLLLGSISLSNIVDIRLIVKQIFPLKIFDGDYLIYLRKKHTQHRNLLQSRNPNTTQLSNRARYFKQ